MELRKALYRRSITATAGIAKKLIQSGVVKVNGKVVTDMDLIVDEDDNISLCSLC